MQAAVELARQHGVYAVAHPLRLDYMGLKKSPGRIDASTYDQKAAEIRERKERVKRRVSERQAETLPTAAQAVELLTVMSKAADLFLEQSGAEQRKLLRVLLESSSWKGGELRISLREPFAQLRLSNLASQTIDNNLSTSNDNVDIWRRKRDSNPRTSYPVNGFQDRRLQPLGHSSVFYLT